ncbi:hypothetical protein L195_g027671 [Trifolium pratense]|uniref:LRAT domain-containing protein n=1 Tax=Trifolium pratense TaxID=57577 RepID=A0A2K3KZS8_TRIPR|nr:hypothetical protein L195_g027671 [Trifolium pratense]
MGVFFNKIDRKQLKPGDHIYSWRKAYLYAHHGIYVGDGMVINFTSGAVQGKTRTPTILGSLITSSSSSSFYTDIPCPRCGDDGSQTRTHSVISSCLDCFLSGGKLRLYQYGVNKLHFIVQARGGTCTFASSDPMEEVLHRAFYLLENGFGDYHVSKNNCEDFAIYCKTGLRVTAEDSSVGGSGQAASFKAGVKSAFWSALPYVVSSSCCLTIYSGSYCYRRVVSDIGFRRNGTKVPVEKNI